MNFIPNTEKSSDFTDLEKKSTLELLQQINKEDHTVATAVQKAIPHLEKLVDGIVDRLKEGGRLFYIGAGTSGRLGILDASECPPTYGVPPTLVTGIIAGGDAAIRKAVEGAEDNTELAWQDLVKEGIESTDALVGIAASGTTPYVIGGLKEARKKGVLTGCITCNPGAPIIEACEFPVVANTGPEFVTGSTRMKAGTAQKMLLNMITTTTMIKLGRVKGNKMVDMQLSNAKLIRRGTKMVMDQTDYNEEKAREQLLHHGSVRRAVEAWSDKN
jgi:N-acetylmuramic acid 6-phosphate etherase